MSIDNDLRWALQLAVAFAIGLLVGLERGWTQRDAGEGQRGMGLRTFALIGLLGGIGGLLGESMAIAADISETASGEQLRWLASLPVGLLFIGLSVLLAGSYRATTKAQGDLGATTEVAGLVTFLLAAMAGLGQLEIASTGAVLMVIVLNAKQRLHGWVGALNRPELRAVFELLLISVVLLPLLPNRGFGPGDALNPYVIWWMVVLVASISFVGYFAIRVAGARGGVIFTALFGGLASSTATTLSLARLAKRKGASPGLLAGGILLACAMMFPRMVLVAGLLHRPLLEILAVPALVTAGLIMVVALWMLRRGEQSLDPEQFLPSNPMELKTAFFFGAVLAVVMLLGRVLTDWLGDSGVYVLAAASGVADVDAITLTLARMAGEQDVAAGVAAIGILVAAAVNSGVKAGMAWSVGGTALGWRVAGTLVPAVAIGLLLAAVFR